MHDRNASLILKAREPYYRQASLHLDTSGKTVAQSFKALLKLLEGYVAGSQRPHGMGLAGTRDMHYSP